MFVKTTNGQIDQYPYTVGNLRRDNPQTSFPKRPSDDLLAEWGVYPVAKADRPTVDHTKNVTEGDPVLIDGTWTQVWETTDATAEEIAERTEREVKDRAERLKAECRKLILAEVDETEQANIAQAGVIYASMRADGEDAATARAIAGFAEGDLTTAAQWKAWVSAMQAECKRAITEGNDPVWPPVPEGVADMAARF